MSQPVEVAPSPVPEPTPVVESATTISTENPIEIANVEAQPATLEGHKPAQSEKPKKPKRSPRTKKVEPKPEETQAVQTEKQKRPRRTKTQKVE